MCFIKKIVTISLYISLMLAIANAQKLIKIPKVFAKPTLDGYMDELWRNAAIDSFLYGSNLPDDDLAGELRMMWHDDSLYILISVIDDTIGINNGDWWNNDALDLFIDGGNEKTSQFDQNDVGMGYKLDDPNLSAVWSDADFMISDFAKCKFTSSQSGPGYIYEIAMAGSDLFNNLGIQLESGTEFGIELGIYDNDSGVRDDAIFWSFTTGDRTQEPGSWGTAVLLEGAVYEAEITYELPDIDGAVDDVWNSVQADSINLFVRGDLSTTSNIDHSAEFRMMWTPDSLYILISVTDDMINIEDPYFWGDDGIMLTFDGGNDKGELYNENDVAMGSSYDDDSLADVACHAAGHDFTLEDFAGCRFITQATASGYNFEIAIPSGVLEDNLDIILTEGTEFGFDPIVYDADIWSQESILSWSTASEMYWNSPCLWGNVILTGIPQNITAVTDDPGNITYNSAQLNGTVNPGGSEMEVYFEYGETTAYGTSTEAVQSPVSGNGDVSVTAQVSGLAAATMYHYRVYLTDGSVTIHGTDKTFTTNDITLIATTGNVTDITYTSAVLHGTVNPNGLEMNAYFEYGDTTNYGNSIPADQNPVSGSSPVEVSAQITELFVGATYHYRIVLSNNDHTIYGTDQTFETMFYPLTINLTDTIAFPVKDNPRDYLPTDYRIIGLPGNSQILLGELFTGEQTKDWQVFWDNGAATSYLVEYDGSNIFRALPGRAFWALNTSPLDINYQNIAPVRLNNDGEAEIQVHPGWNLITNPFPEPIEWIKVREVNQITQQIPIWSFNGSFNTESILEPYTGYYFDHTTSDQADSILRVPFMPIPPVIEKQNSNNDYQWKVTISFAYNEITDNSTFIGVKQDAENGPDKYEFRKPRTITGEVVGIYLNRPEDKSYTSYANDIRPPFPDLAIWNIQVSIPEANTKPSFYGKSVLSFSGINDISEEFSVILINQASSDFIDLRKQNSYQFTPERNISSFTIMVGKDELIRKELQDIIPKEFSLSQNYPNPFNPRTTIPFALPTEAEVTIKIYNIMGQEVIELVSAAFDAGKHHVSWDGRDNQGNRVASGVYVVRMSTNAGKHLTGKMVLLK